MSVALWHCECIASSVEGCEYEVHDSRTDAQEHRLHSTACHRQLHACVAVPGRQDKTPFAVLTSLYSTNEVLVLFLTHPSDDGANSGVDTPCSGSTYRATISMSLVCGGGGVEEGERGGEEGGWRRGGMGIGVWRPTSLS